ncbi:MAG: permease-like cell division protein FtsX [Bacteroidales bacterium]|nr:permease-like cell division protein FtsX [Bacteroidales bacterium]
MENKKNPLISTFSAQITSTISVALVLLVLGVVAILGVAARNVTREIREHMGFDIIMVEDVEPTAVNDLKRELAKAPYVASYSYISAEDALQQWEQDTGEALGELLDVNPFSGEFDVKVKELYASVDSLEAIGERLRACAGVDDITMHAEIVDSINRNIRSVAMVLIIVAGALLLISFVLIHNTVRLTVYSRRFTIYTMKLVGATPGFIRKPFLLTNIVHGIVAALIASGLLAAMVAYAREIDPSVAAAISWEEAVWVMGGMVLLGIVICLLAAAMATNRYLRLSYDEMFR